MKKFLILTAIAATLVFSISSCNKEEDEVDLTTEITGNYTGTVTDSLLAINSSEFPNEHISITKIDNSNVKVSAMGNGVLTSFNAEVSETSGGLILTVASQTSGSTTVSGYSIPVNGVTANGLYKASSKEFVSAVRIVGSNGTIIETFIGVRQ